MTSHDRQRTFLLMILVVVLLVSITFFVRVLQESLDPATGSQVASLAGRSPAPDAWSHGAGQTCTACHPRPESPKQPDWRTIPPGGPPLPEGVEEKGKPRLRLNFFTAQRAYPKTSLPQGARLDALKQTLRMAGQQQLGAPRARWTNIGPAPMRNSTIGQQAVNVSGRVKALVVDPRNSNVVYLGAAQGGVWKTTDGGGNWTPLTDDQPSLAIGAMALDPRNPDTIYVGTGEPHPGLDNYYGAGILKSTDGGNTWRQLGAREFTGLGIAAIIITPNNPSAVYVASSLTGVTGKTGPVRGIFRSTDGGVTWTALLTCEDCWGATDLIMDPSNPNVLYAAFWNLGIYKSIDGGIQWTQLTTGLPESNYGRIELAISASNPAVLYAGYHYTVPDQYDGALVFKTTDGGASWIWLQQAPNYCTGQCWYDNIIAVDPANPDVVYLGGSANYEWQPVVRIKEVVVKSTDGGTTWQDMSPNDSPAHTLHPDMHAIAFDPRNSNSVWIGNDGGVWKSTDGGTAWVNKNSNLATLQFTGIALHPTDPNRVFGGMQDNNKARTTGSIVWDALDVGDGGHAAIDPFDPRYYYGSRYGISFQRNDNGGSSPVDDWPMKTDGIDRQDRALFYAPFALDPSIPGVIYYGTYRLYRTTSRGDSWTPVSGDLTKGTDTAGSISAIAVAPSAPGTIYVGTSDGNIQVTANTGGSWTDVTKDPLPNRWVSDFAFAHNDPRTAYVVFNGFNTHTPDTPGHVFKTTDAGASWRNISANIPDVPALTIVLDRDAPGTFYVGTDVGVFYSSNDGTRWEPFNDGLPNVAVVDLVLNQDARVLVAGTHGRSVYRVQLGPPQIPATPTPTSTPTGPRPTPGSVVYLPLALKRLLPVTPGPTETPGPPTRTPTPTSSPVPTGTPTSTPTATAIGSPTPTATVAGTVFPTQTPTATPTTPPSPTPTETPGGPTPIPTQMPSPRVYFDDFSDSDSGWWAGITDTCESAYVGGEYGIGIRQLYGICPIAAPAGPRINGTYEVKAGKVSVDDGSIYGLMFGLDDPSFFNEFYVFWVDPFDLTYLLQRYDYGTWTDLTEVGTSLAINLGSGTNTLKVRREGAMINLYVNGVYLTTVYDDSFPNNGYVGLVNWAFYDALSAVTFFDDFKVSIPTVIIDDHFSDRHSGWPFGAVEACQASYTDGEYRTATEPDFTCLYRAPGGSHPNGLFEVAARREESVYPTAYGVIFGEDGTFSTFYAFLVVPDTQEYTLAKYDGSWWALTWDYIEDDAWTYSPAINPGTGINALKVERDSSLISVYVNDTYVDTISDASFPENGYFGVVNWASAYAPVISSFDDFRVTVWDEPPWEAARITSGPAASSLEATEIKRRPAPTNQ